MRYLILLLLNLPLVLLALVNIITQYKISKSSKRKFKRQIITWLIILIIILASFPLYNYLIGRSLLNSNELSFFDIAEITTIIYLFYSLNNQRRKVEQADRTINNLHREISIIISEEKK